MEMFEGKSGHRIFSERDNAEFVAEKNGKIEEKEFEVQEVKVIDQEVARRLNLSIHPDLSISARAPKEGETGWIVTENPEELSENYGEALELMGE
ncbi:hypothetical protein AKJ57_00300 [candidate division MSBL1 archaeon SCGC-AAA259A05]|uniref:Uncharacterized protein n=1 Tax=candidate division MSBL1 archaeon SCGC-AAA259A05 TaxID=1698259 RepID=A0A133UBU2_9EURY|nr:hypothetical protein AKJ57_00300 [candidate division MSBL1 archaeon SCGC-AAA259A05]